MKKIVIMPGGFHPFHAGHMALYTAAREAFPSADVFVAATDDTSARPFPFKTKKFLAQQAGVPGNRFIRVKSPFRAEEITQMYDPNDTALIFVRSEKDAQKQPQAGGVKKDGSASYLQPYKRNGLEPFSKHGYMAYLPTVQFGPGMTSATEIRAKWPEMTPEEKISLVKVLYPSTAGKDAAAGKIVTMLDEIMGETVQEIAPVVGAVLGGALARSAGAGALGQLAGRVAGSSLTSSLDKDDVEEAVLINDPDAGHQIRPDGGMGTWDEASLKSNLAGKFASMLQMLKSGDYDRLHYVLQKGQVVDRMVQSLAEYQAFMARQGRRPIARGREIEMSDYLDEKRIDEIGGGGPMAAPIVAAALVDKMFNKDKEQVSEARGPWYPKEFDNWQQDAVAYGFTIEKVPNPPTGQSVQAYYVKNPKGEIVGFWDGKSGNGVLSRTPQEYQAEISNKGMTAGGYDAYDKEVATNWSKALPIIKRASITRSA